MLLHPSTWERRARGGADTQQLSFPISSKPGASTEQQVQQPNVFTRLAAQARYHLKIPAHLREPEEEPNGTDFCSLGKLTSTFGGIPAWASSGFGSTSLFAAISPRVCD